MRQSPYIETFYHHPPPRVTIDSGATANMIRLSAVKTFGAETIHKSSYLANESSPLTITGETRLTFVRDHHNFLFEGLIVEHLDVDILAGIPFRSATTQKCVQPNVSFWAMGNLRVQVKPQSASQSSSPPANL